jgi:hypothetical protein
MMTRKENYYEWTRDAAAKALDANSEMLHAFPPDEYHCMHCGKWKPRTEFDEECPALLRCAISQLNAPEKKAVGPLKICAACGSRMVMIRGRYPRDEDRPACATCAVERLEQIHQISSPDYGVAFAASPLIQPAGAGRGDTDDALTAGRASS